MSQELVNLGAATRSQRPSFFELLAAERLTAAVQAAISYSLASAGSRTRLGQMLSEGAPELTCLAMLIINRQALIQNDCSFAELLYGLHRVAPARPRPGVEPRREPPGVPAPLQRPLSSPVREMEPAQRAAALLVLVYAPYVRSKLDELHQTLSQDRDIERMLPEAQRRALQPQSLAGRAAKLAKEAFVACYPVAKTALDALRLAYQLAYLLDLTDWWSPELHAMGLVVKRTTQDEAKNLRDRLEGHRQTLLDSWGGDPAQGPAAALRRVLLRATFLTSDWARSGVALAVFGFKLLEWWYTTGEEQLPHRKTPVPPPPPGPPPPSQWGVGVPKDPSLCPLCKGARANSAVLTVSGYVFCEACIARHVARTGRCPVTLIPARAGHVRKLFLE